LIFINETLWYIVWNEGIKYQEFTMINNSHIYDDFEEKVNWIR
jgi:hypothetical protein